MGIRISEMEEATTFGADDYVPIVTSGTNKKALGAKIKDFIAGFFATKTGDNISDKEAFRSAIEISATNTPFDKTGTGMTAENVQAGIAELSGNRALINGSNIADKETFRQNIGLTTSTTTLTNPVSQVYAQHITKKNDVVYLYVDINNLNTTTEVVIGNIPSGYRPLHRINYEALVIASSDASFKGYAHINIQTNGNISYKSLGSYTGSFTTINIAYPVD